MERTSDEAPSAQSVNYTRTGRIAKSKKGLKVHHCDCGRVSVFSSLLLDRFFLHL